MSECKHIKTFYRVEYVGVLKPLNRYPNGTITPLTIPHDLFHHFPNDTGLVEDELRAFGALIYISDNNFLSLNLRQYDYLNIVEDITNLFTYKHPCNIAHCKKSANITQSEDKKIINDIKDKLLSFDSDYYFNEFGDVMPSHLQVLNVIRWVCKGYNEAKRRYIGINQSDLSNYYYSILQELQSFKVSYGYVYVDVDISIGRLQIQELGYLTFAEYDPDKSKYVIGFEEDPTFYVGTCKERFKKLCKQLEIW